MYVAEVHENLEYASRSPVNIAVRFIDREWRQSGSACCSCFCALLPICRANIEDQTVIKELRKFKDQDQHGEGN